MKRSLNPLAAAVLLVAVALYLAALKFVPEAKDMVAILGLVVQSQVGQLVTLTPKEDELELPPQDTQ